MVSSALLTHLQKLLSNYLKLNALVVPELMPACVDTGDKREIETVTCHYPYFEIMRLKALLSFEFKLIDWLSGYRKLGGVALKLKGQCVSRKANQIRWYVG